MIGVSPARSQQPSTQPAVPATRPSPADISSNTIDGNRVMIVYSRPYSKAPGTNEVRKIWGTLVPFGQVWRLGANEATLLITPQPITIGNVDVPAGTYSLFMLPQENGVSKLIINKQFGQLGNQHDEKQDLGRADMTKSALPETLGQLAIMITPNATGGGALAVKWENSQFTVPITAKK